MVAMAHVTRCMWCDQPFDAKRNTAKYCSDRHKMAAARARKAGKPVGNPEGRVILLPQPIPGEDGAPEYGPVETETRTQLERAERLNTPLGQAALAFARKLDNGQRESGMGFAAVGKEFNELFENAMSGASLDNDELDELRLRRERRFGRA